MVTRTAIIGASAPSTISLFKSLAVAKDTPEMHFSLIGRDTHALQAVSRAAGLLCNNGRISVSTQPMYTKGWESSLEKAEQVIVQLRVGGYAGRKFDESFPLHFGVCGDEGLGPGGLSAAWRAWPIMSALLQTIKRVSPKATVIMLSSPVSLLVRLGYLTTPSLRLFGICELPWTTLQDICCRCQADAGQVEFGYLGLNHQGVFSSVRSGNRDLLNEIQSQNLDVVFPRQEHIHRCGGYPGKYLRVNLEHDCVLKEQLEQSTTRADFLGDFSRAVFSACELGNMDQILARLQSRSAPWYDHAVVPLLVSLANRRRSVPLFLTTRNDGYEGSFKNDDVIEVPYSIKEGRLERLQNSAVFSQTTVDLLRPIVTYERLAARAVVARDEGLLANAISHHPWGNCSTKAKSLAQELVRGNLQLESRHGVSS